MNKPSTVLLVVSDPLQSGNLKALIQNFGVEVHAVERYNEGVKILNENVPSLVVIDSNLDGLHWSAAASKIKEVNRDIPIFLLTPAIGKEESSNIDISGFIKTPVNHADLQDKIARYLKKGNEDCALPQSEDPIPEPEGIDNLILGKSKRILDVKNIIRRVADADVTVLLRGESGTGKELAAQALCRCSKRKGKPFVKVLCAAIPEGLLESELFGHEKGAFTGAHRSKPGKFEFANGGTIFLDEIGDVPHSLQVKLLQVLQDGEFSKVGGKEVKVDVRVIAATNKNLERGVATGTFREDLFYRLNVVGITMPSLRERKEDIPVLTDFFMHKYCQLYNKELPVLSQETMERFIAYPWPGNVRELENVIKRIIVLGNEKIELGHHTGEAGKTEVVHPERSQTPEKIKEASDSAVDSFKPCSLRDVAQEAIRKVEEETIKKALIACRWNKRKAAEILSISYKTLFYKMKRYNLLE